MCRKARTGRPVLSEKKKEDHEQVREDPSHSDRPEWRQEFRENLVGDRVPERRDSPNTVLKITSLKTEIARSARGPKLQGPRAEDVLAESYLVQKILVINYSRSQSSQ